MTHLDDAADLRAVMERSLRDLDQPDHLHATVLGRGRRARRRRQAALAVGGLAAGVTAIGLTAAALHGTSSTTSGIDPAAPPSAVTPSDLPTDLPTVPAHAPSGWWDVPGPELRTALEQVLPDGVTMVSAEVLVETGADEQVVGRGAVHGVLEGPSGRGAFQVLLSPPAPAGRAAPAAELRCAATFEQCRQVRADGSPTARFSTATAQGTTYREAVVREPDGGRVYVYVADSSGEKPGYEAPSASAPPLDADQLRALAQDPVWTSWTP